VRILANENIPRDAVELLRQRGHDVVWIRSDAPGATDQANLTQAVSQQRLLITFDKDFGELVFRLGLAASYGIVLFRIDTPSATVAAKTIAETLDTRTDWVGQFSVVDSRRIRMTPLPPNRPRPR
jgi:predicted nuclease of predicted toxin-antitoxin system